MVDITDERKRILERFKKIIALQKSPNVNEAANAVLRMKEYMAKYSVTIDELKLIQDKKEQIEEITFDSDISVPRKWMRYLAVAVSKFFDCDCFMDRDGGKFVFVGYPMDIEVSRETFEYLVGIIRHNANVITKEQPIHKKNGAINDFSMGAMHSIVNRFDEEKKKIVEQMQSSTALAVVKNSEIKNYLGKHHPNLRKGEPGTFHASAEYVVGRLFGETVSLRKMKQVESHI